MGREPAEAARISSARTAGKRRRSYVATADKAQKKRPSGVRLARGHPKPSADKRKHTSASTMKTTLMLSMATSRRGGAGVSRFPACGEEQSEESGEKDARAHVRLLRFNLFGRSGRLFRRGFRRVAFGVAADSASGSGFDAARDFVDRAAESGERIRDIEHAFGFIDIARIVGRFKVLQGILKFRYRSAEIGFGFLERLEGRVLSRIEFRRLIFGL